MTMGAVDSNLDRWIWIELIGFDNELNDFGVEAFMDNAGFVPDAASLLLFNPDFVHNHAGMEQERALPFDCCSYGGHPYNEQRSRQEWSSHQLRGLVCELQQRGVKVYASVFDGFVTQDWLADHPEVLHVRKNGQQLASVCPWKRLSDGSYYEDFFVEQLVRVMRDYGFDGYHGADGYSHPRIPVYDGDFSDDMVGQFTDITGTPLPDDLRGACDGEPNCIERRAEWIWRNLRREWIEFYTERIARFWGKVFAALHAEGKKVVLNSAWTRDPFEAKYRYGIDYRRLVDLGVDGFIVEAAAAASETERQASSAAVLFDFMAMLLLIKAYVPEAKLWYLHGVKDTQEQWNVLRHAPTAVEREVYSLSNLYVHRDDGALQRCASGLVVCLADDIRRHEWQWLREKWNLAFDGTPQRVIGATLVWSDRALEAQMDDFIATRRWTTHRLLHHLMARGAPVHAAVNVKHLDATSGPLLVLNPHLFPEDELHSILDYGGGPVVAVGGKTGLLPEPKFFFEDVYSPNALCCAIYGATASSEVWFGAAEAEDIAEDLIDLRDPTTFIEDLPVRKVSEEFLRGCVVALSDIVRGVRVLEWTENIKTQILEKSVGQWRCFLGNDRHGYLRTQVDAGRSIVRINVMGDFPGVPVQPDGSKFRVRIPGRGMIVVDIELE